MKTLNELRELYVGARNLAKEADPERAVEAANMLVGISDHCKELYDSYNSILDKAKCRSLYQSIDNVVLIMNKRGFCDENVMAFFGLENAKGPSFSDISSGNGYISRSNIPADTPTETPSETPTEAPVKKPDTGLGSLIDNGGSPSHGKRGTKLSLPPKPVPANSNGNDSNPEEPPADPDTPDAPVTPDEPPADIPTDDPTPPSDPTDPDIPSTDGDEPADSDEGDGDDVSPGEDIINPSLDTLDPVYFDDFIGQTHVVSRLKKEIAAAKKKGKRHIDHVMLFGNRGLGKSTLMRILANELGVQFEFIDCTSLRNDVKSQRNFNEFFIRISKLEEPVVIGLDEIHALPGKIQENLLVLLETGIYSYLDENGNSQKLHFPEFTFIGATTDHHKIIITLRDRCKNLSFILRDYTRNELKQILVNKLGAMGLSTTESVCNSCINRCRSSIRDITAIVKGINTMAIIDETTLVTQKMADEYFEERNMDALGLSDIERNILNILANDLRGAMSEETLAAKLYVDRAILTSEYEPYLLKMGLIEITGKGRAITDKARIYLKYGYFDFGDGNTIGSLPESSEQVNV